MELCRFVGIVPTVLSSKLPTPLRYFVLLAMTALELAKTRPRCLIVQNPSVVLTLFACLLKGLVGYRLIVDAHNAGIHPDHELLKRLSFVYRYICRTADVTIVTNAALALVVESRGGTPLILPDKLPSVQFATAARENGFSVVYICTFSPDEPFQEFFEAATILSDSGINFKITGAVKGVHASIPAKYPLLSFTGFLPDADYWQLLAGADLIVDLTTREDCLLCGAYEAVALGVPMVLTDTKALRSYFKKGVVYTDNSSDDIARSILEAKTAIDAMRRDIVSLRAELQGEWGHRGGELLDIIKAAATGR
jgi:glycosyltransferase involved in cell wall biosynthesis